MKESPLIILRMEGLGVELLGSVHALGSNVPRITGEIERWAPGFIALELTDPSRMTGSMDVDSVKVRFPDRVIPIDRSPEITVSRYLCDTPPSRYLRECMRRFAWLPFNGISIFAFNYLNGAYRTLFGDYFYTFGWSEEDTRKYIYERDEYMAARLIGHMRSRRDEGYRDSYAVVVGRRHVAGMAAILEAYEATGDVGSYYAGGRILDVFSTRQLEQPYEVSREAAMHNLSLNRTTESLGRAIVLPVYMLFLFLITAFLAALIVTAILSFLI